MKPRSYQRLALLYGWLSVRERMAWDKSVRSYDLEESRAWLRRSDRWNRLAQRCAELAQEARAERERWEGMANVYVGARMEVGS